jgi:hypothetical protein
MDEPTRDPPFPDTCHTGRAFITPCCTASTHEFRVDGVLHLASRVAGHGWSAPWRGCIEDINHTGTIVDGPGQERRVYWRADREAQ